jgi:hypothetical protein
MEVFRWAACLAFVGDVVFLPNMSAAGQDGCSMDEISIHELDASSEEPAASAFVGFCRIFESAHTPSPFLGKPSMGTSPLGKERRELP